MLWNVLIAVAAVAGTFVVMRKKMQREFIRRDGWRESVEAELTRLKSKEANQEAQLSAMSHGLKLAITPVGPNLRVLERPEVHECEGPRQSSEGEPCYQVLWKREEPCEDCPATRSFDSGQAEAGEFVTGTGPSDRQYYQVITSPVHGPDGQVTHVLEMVRDVSDRRRIEVQLLQAGKMAALGELASSIAHEMNNPLASISAYAEQLVEAAKPPALTALPEFRKFPGHLAVIRKNVKRCSEIMRTLLDFARQKEEAPELLKIESALAETLCLVEFDARQQGIKLERQIPEDLPWVRCSKGELQQVFLNLLTNALDASPKASVITVRARQESGEVAIEFEDRGCGIPEANREQIFSPFFTTKPQGKGTGLGLAICARILKRMRGRLTFVSREGQGTTFTIWLAKSQSPANSSEAA
ncbi:MAG: GHKL domain-containing protein [Candidatus Wallbacteria bacterium]|nr:GHKL domain-containing protein [Candidatus Wallbacteria bacterium]